jgi:hypothetical protein
MITIRVFIAEAVGRGFGGLLEKEALRLSNLPRIARPGSAKIVYSAFSVDLSTGKWNAIR